MTTSVTLTSQMFSTRELPIPTEVGERLVKTRNQERPNYVVLHYAGTEDHAGVWRVGSGYVLRLRATGKKDRAIVWLRSNFSVGDKVTITLVKDQQGNPTLNEDNTFTFELR